MDISHRMQLLKTNESEVGKNVSVDSLTDLIQKHGKLTITINVDSSLEVNSLLTGTEYI